MTASCHPANPIINFMFLRLFLFFFVCPLLCLFNFQSMFFFHQIHTYQVLFIKWRLICGMFVLTAVLLLLFKSYTNSCYVLLTDPLLLFQHEHKLSNYFSFNELSGPGWHTYKRRDCFHCLHTKAFSVYLLQDTHFEHEQETMISVEWGYTCLCASFRREYLFDNKFEFSVKSVYRDNEGNHIIAVIKTLENDILICNVYVPIKDNPKFYSHLEECVRQLGT